MGLSWTDKFAETAYIVSSVFFIFTLHSLSKVESSRRGNAYGIFGMLLAIVGTIVSDAVDSYVVVAVCVLIGFAIGGVCAKVVKMDQMPQLVAVLNAFGGFAAALEGLAAILEPPSQTGGELVITKIFIVLGVVVGMVTFFGSLIAMLKLQEIISGKPFLVPGRNLINGVIALSWFVCCALLLATDNNTWEAIYVGIVVVTSSIVGVHFVMAIGGADMPVVVSMLNSCSGWAGCSTGFMLSNNLLIITGALVGASGWILSVIMCRAMNRSFMNVIFGQWGGEKKASRGPGAADEHLEAIPVSADDTSELLLNSKRVVIVPGYGMAVAKAQSSVAELTRVLRARNIQVVFGIHPVAGRLPGHMNVLLSESKVPYDIVLEMDEVNPDFEDKTDVVLVIGANDIVNPAAEDDPDSSIAGMPVIQVWKSKTVVVFKRSLRPGYAGVENPLFYRPNTRMLFGDAKDSVDKILDAVRKAAAPAAGAAGAGDVELEVVGEGTNLLNGVEEVEEPIVATGLTVGVVKEVREGEMRVALTPDVSKRLLKMNFKVAVESGAGEAAHFRDDLYERFGCQILDNTQMVYDTADIMIKIRAPMEHPVVGKHEIDMMHPKQVLVSFIWPAQNGELLTRLAEKGVSVVAVDCVPRITTAQRLDVLSSMAKIGGYRAIIEAANHFGRFFGGEITAAGKVPPCKVLVIGAGVAGLSAIGTAHAMGAVVRSFDTRPVVKEEVLSMGAEFLEVEMEEEGAGAGGYARVMSPEFIRAEMALFAAQCREVDIVVTTALIPGRPAPKLITKDMVESMANGSVIVDMAAEQGGNCEVTRPNEIFKHKGVTIIGITDLPSRMAKQSSEMYARNMANLLDEMSKGSSNNFTVDMENKIVRGCTTVHRGEITWPPPTIEPSAAAPPVEEDARPVIMRRPVKERDLLYMVIVTIVLFAAGLPSPDTFLPLMMVFVLACVVGWKIIWNVAAALHTPLMSVTNSVSGIVLVGAMIQLSADLWSATMLLASVACIISSINIAGGFLVTQKMLGFFVKSD